MLSVGKCASEGVLTRAFWGTPYLHSGDAMGSACK